MDQLDDTPGSIIEVGDGREGIQAGGMELVAVLHGQLGEAREILLLDATGHLLHALRHNGLSPELQGEQVGGWVGGWSYSLPVGLDPGPQEPSSHQGSPTLSIARHSLTALTLGGALVSTVPSKLTLSRVLVSTLVCMPTVLPVCFFSALT